MLPLRVMAQMSNYRTDNKTQVHHKAPTPHIPILYLSKRFFTGGGWADKNQPHIHPRWDQQRARSLFTHRPRCQRTSQSPGPLAVAAPGPGRALRARSRSSAPRSPPSAAALRARSPRRPMEPKMAPGPNKARSERARPPRSRHSPALNSLEAAARPTPPP